ncbi:MAG: ATP-dependent helicase [Candidatus Omnitrophica bacterium]|jgi:DNA helicase-2/ATP-dependent DNA helicase PcrA|nr:ATP-dependent helicase [Candidatus Omnitrophota bacterium]
MSQDLQNQLNPAQIQAVTSTEGPYLVIAGAGSGKTRVLVHRVAHLVSAGVNPEQILLLTFTRKAAEEMLRRASILLDSRCHNVSGGTFHSFANYILRQYASLVNLSSNFTILDDADSADIINLARVELGMQKFKDHFPKKQTIQDIISKAVNKSDSIESIAYDEYPQFMQWVEELEKIKNEYSSYKQKHSMLDYDDLLVYLKQLLSTHEEIRDRLSDKYRYIMVDEYQDTNKIQAEIVCLLAKKHSNVMVVGDDAQSIYSFRGANFRNIMDFPLLFKGTNVIKLEENYRSVKPILDLTNQIIRFSEEKFDKELFTSKKGGSVPVYSEVLDEHAQSKYVADKIVQLLENGTSLSEVAVLFRSGWHSNDLEVELASRSIPFVKYGGQKFVEAAHIKDILSYLRISYNLLDTASWMRLLLLMPSIGVKTAGRFIQEVVAKGDVFNLKHKILDKTSVLRSLCVMLKDIQGKNILPVDLIEGFLKHYEPLLKDKYDDHNKRVNDLDSLMRIAARYKSLERFLTDMALEPPEKSLAGRDPHKKDDVLTLSTIHSAKGLEWENVFLIYLAEGHLPSYLSVEKPQAVEEERRLLYVALTRAKQRLFMIKPQLNRSGRSYFGSSNTMFNQPSRFIIQDSLIEKYANIENSSGESLGIDDVEFEDILG